MIVIDAGGDGTAAPDIIDAGDTSTPPTDIYDSQYQLPPQFVTQASPMITPMFTAVDTNTIIQPDNDLVLHVKFGSTATQMTVVVPGTQPYTEVPRTDRVDSGLQNTQRTLVLPPLLTDSSSEVVTLSFSQTTDVTAALLKVT